MGYSIDKFFVSKLITTGNDEYRKLLFNGAIPINDKEVLVLMYVFNKSSICLFNGEVYNNMKDKVYLKRLLPNINGNINDKLSLNEAKKLFDKLYNKTIFSKPLYDNTSYNADDFFVGNLLIKDNNAFYSKQINHNFDDINHNYYIYYGKLFLKINDELYCVNINQMVDDILFKTSNLESIKTKKKQLTIKKALQIVK